MIRHWLFFVLLLVVLGGGSTAVFLPTSLSPHHTTLAQTAPTLFVALDGSDDSGDGSAERPFRTLTHAAPLAPPGSTIYLRGGVYHEQTVFSAVGTAVNPITIQPAPGETVIFDGTGLPIPDDQHLVLISESTHVLFTGFEMTNSSGRGLGVFESEAITLRDNRVHEIRGRGIGGGGNLITIEDNEVWRTSLENENEAFNATGGWKAGISTYRRFDGSPSTNFVIRHNQIHDIWGEGIIAIFADGVQIDGNEIHDTYSVNIYIDNARNVTINGNYLYATTTRYNRSDRFVPANAIHLANESYDNAPATQLDNIIIANNLMLGTGRGVSYWHDQSNLDPSNSYRNVSIVYNVIADTHEDAIRFDGVGLFSQPPQNVLVQNNIIFAGGNGEVLNIGNSEGWTFSHNNWPDGVPELAEEPDSFAANPLFANPGLAGRPEDFMLQPHSSSIGAGQPFAPLPVDYLGRLRDPQRPSLGIFEMADVAAVDEEAAPGDELDDGGETAVSAPEPTPLPSDTSPQTIGQEPTQPTPTPPPAAPANNTPANDNLPLIGGIVFISIVLLFILLRFMRIAANR
ncbi:MAG: right-handed parallel beta-helix repeat-containing protein [Anaerolineales bacterium]|nr:right-handed parallel beta-helix repeat-containing protein [Anaerolineales bacterium]